MAAELLLTRIGADWLCDRPDRTDEQKHLYIGLRHFRGADTTVPLRVTKHSDVRAAFASALNWRCSHGHWSQCPISSLML